VDHPRGQSSRADPGDRLRRRRQLEHLREGLAVERGGADAALAASIFHFGLYTISQAKQYLAEHGIPVRPHESQRGASLSSAFS
jgi:hypothetical protein